VRISDYPRRKARWWRNGVRAVLVASALAASGPAAALDGVDREAVADGFAHWSARLGATSAALGNGALADGVLLLEGVELGWRLPGVLLGSDLRTVVLAADVPEVRLERLQSDGDRLSAQALRIPSIRFSLGKRSLELRDLVLRKLSFGAAPQPAAGARPGALAHLEPVVRWLIDVEAASLAFAADGTRVEADAVVDGEVARIRVAPAAGAGEDTSFAGPIQLAGVDLGALVAAFFETRSPPQRRTLVERVVVPGLSTADTEGQRIDVDRILVRDVSLANASPSIAASSDAFLALETAGAVVAEESRQALLARLAGLLAVGEVAVTGFRTEGPDGEHTALDRLSLTGLAPGRTAALVAEGLTFAGATDAGRIDRLAITDIVLPGADDLVRLSGTDAPTVEESLAAAPRIGRVEVDGFSSSGPAGSFGAESLVIVLGEHVGPIPTRLEYRSRFTVGRPAGVPEEAAAFLDEEGIADLGIEEVMRAEWDGRAETLTVDWAGEVEDLVRYRFALTLAGVDRVLFERPDRAGETFDQLALAEAVVEVEDEGLVDLGLALVAREGGDREEAVTALADFLKTAVAPHVPLPLGRGPREVAETILSGGGSFVVAARPQRPIPLVEIVGAAALFPLRLPLLLGLSLETSP